MSHHPHLPISPPGYTPAGIGYTRRPSASTSPIDRAGPGPSMGPRAIGSGSGERRGNGDERHTISPRPLPTSSSRIALSALVNSPPPPPAKMLSHSPPTYPSPHHLPHQHQHQYQTHGRYVSPVNERYRLPTPPSRYPPPAPNPVYDSHRPTSPYHPVNGMMNGVAGPSRKMMVRDARLLGSEETWEETLRVYQKRREAEVAEISQLDFDLPMGSASASSSKPSHLAGDFESVQPRPLPLTETVRAHSRKNKQMTEPRPNTTPVPLPELPPVPASVGGPHLAVPLLDPAKIPPKRKGWPADHPTRIAQREAKEAAIAAGIELPKRKYHRKTRKEKAAALDAELLGLADGEAAHSSPMPGSDAFDGEDGEEEAKADAVAEAESEAPAEPTRPDTIVLPCGLTRAEVIAKVEANDMIGLTENDVKAVQDEMWLRKKDVVGGALIRKDGTVRKKPGPAKGWKKLRGDVGGKRGAEGDWDSDAGDTSVAGDTVNGELDADLAALLPDEGPRVKRVKLDHDEEDEDGDEDDEEDGRRGSLDGQGSRPLKHKEPGVGKGRWARPTKPEKDLLKMTEEIAVQVEPEVPDDELAPNVENLAPNSQDARGVSEYEAKIRCGLVEELQRQAWFSIVRDIPRMYRVYQAFDTVVKQDCARKAQAAVRNAFGQRTMKPTYKSAARMNKDAGFKAKRIVKEMLMYWRKNEKEELVARKKAEKQAVDRAKAEEEARESKRQARKLNFLLTQTELYSHFIGKKIKTAEAEDMEAEMNAEGNEEPGLDEGGEALPDIDYDDDDEENLRKHAARGAQAAVQAAKDKAKAFDDSVGGRQAEPIDLDGDELNFQNPSMGQDQITITQPKMLIAQLKEYQLKGLTWLGNLYEQGINGILADEMGLGKTIQSISLLAYLAEHHNLWGPFLVIAPSSTLHNWQQELVRFVPRLKALPYWGTPKDRETLRRIWSRKNMTFSEDSPFHILVTSYQLAVQDEKYFQGMRWQYMILDEAQAIKSSSSARWKSLLSLHCRNRLLLTGTPIQNSMHELWALLHFIMPSLFDSHEEFSEWFSRDIENAAGGGSGTLKPEQLRRLHMILKPFMLRRVKKHVQKELGDKIEIDLHVDLSQRQRNIYKALRQRVSVSDLIAQANNLTDSLGAKNLMNLVMQFRKVCNHPDLFERADVVSPFLFGTFSQSGNFAREGDVMYCPDSARNAIEVKIPKILWTDGGKVDVPGEESLAGSDTHLLRNLMSIWTPGWIADSLRTDESQFGFLDLMGISPGEVAKRARSHPLVSLLRDAEDTKENLEFGGVEADRDFVANSRRRFHPIPARLPYFDAPADQRRANVTPLRDITARAWNQSYLSRRTARFAVENAVAPFIKPVASNRSFMSTQSRLINDPLVQQAVYGVTPSERDDPAACALLADLAPGISPLGLLASAPQDQTPLSSMRVPAIKRLIVDSAKLARLDDLLRELRAGSHRVLLYFQMTKMMDLVEEYLIYRQYKYLRLDGSSPIGDRRDMVTSWQTNPDIFIFCLSTRAGGLGINLTAADTVIFYDHDWNPSNDAQAMDRAHRVGQTKQVTVYRLIARGTIEERIVKLARAKKDVQDIVVGTKSLTDVAKPSEIVSLFMDDEELAESVAKRKQAEAHGYVAPAIVTGRSRTTFGDGLGAVDEDEDDFFSLAKKPVNNEDEDFGDEAAAGSGTGTPDVKPKRIHKRKAGEGGDSSRKPVKKKVKIALGPDGLPI